ncbi:hypothetical protein COOONC_08631 [Cooperia oncophora]
MAWHSSVRLGCAIQRCPQFYVVVCQYGPGGNVIGEAIYDVGPTCSRCPTGTSCEQATGLCSTSASPTPSATNTVTIPPATNTRYDCSLEAAAIRHALTCDGELSPLESRPNAKENIQKVNNLALDYTAAANQAMTTWWSELAQSYVRSDMLFDSETRHRTSNIVTHWSKQGLQDLGINLGVPQTIFFKRWLGTTMYVLAAPFNAATPSTL